MHINVSEGAVTSINPIPTHFDLIINDRRLEWNYTHHTFFWIETCFLLTWYSTHIVTLKTFKRKKKSKKVIIYQHFLHETYLLLAFVRWRTLVLFFFFFLAFQLFASLNVLFIRPLLPKHLLWEYFTLFSFGGG